MQIVRSRTEYDVCIIGSGAGGGMAAMVLTQAGANVVMLEAGPMWDSATDSAMYKWPYETPRRGAATKERQFGEFDGALGGWTLEGEPYTSAPGSQFDWFRSRMLGGRTNHWGRISLRFGPHDFMRKSLDGLGDDWPITYDDMKPYYDKIDQLIGIFGAPLNMPNEPDGIFLPPPKPRCYELLIKKASQKLNIPSVPSRLSILTKPVNGRAACHYCGQCGRGCATHSNFSSPSVLIPPAMKTGKLKIITGAMAREVTVDDQRPGDRRHLHRQGDQARQPRPRPHRRALPASACESARILLNSKSSKFPNGLANSSGVVGKYLTDSTGASVSGFIPKLMDGIPHNEDGTGGMHLYTPWWLDNKKLDFPRGYHIEPGGGRRMPSAGFGGGIHNFTHDRRRAPPMAFGGYGKELKNDYRRLYGATVNFAGRGEMIPNNDSYCEIDPTVVDQWGIPVLRFHFKWSDYEIQAGQAHAGDLPRHHHRDGRRRRRRRCRRREEGYGIAPGGRIIHEVGVTRMGNDPSTSVLNKNCQAHDAKNVFVADAGPLVSQADKNCTWTILALAMRTAEYIAEQRKIGSGLGLDTRVRIGGRRRPAWRD